MLKLSPASIRFSVACGLLFATFSAASSSPGSLPVPSGSSPGGSRSSVSGAGSGRVSLAMPTRWITRVARSLQQGEYFFTALDDRGYSAPNRALDLRTRIGSDGIEVFPRSASADGRGAEWRLRTQTTGLGRHGELRELQEFSSARLYNYAERVEIERGSMTESIVNTEDGIEQSWTVERPLLGVDVDGPLLVRIELGGDLVAVPTVGGQSVHFVDAAGEVRLRYRDLSAQDAVGTDLAARFLLDSQGLYIEVEDGAAVYPVTIQPVLTGGAWTARSDQNAALFGTSVAPAGDVDGDGFDDLLVGAPAYDSGNMDEGRVFLFSGSWDGLSTDPTWTAAGGQADAGFGGALAGVGDLNGDGYDDVAIGAERFDVGAGAEGRVVVFLGGPGGLATEPSWSVSAGQPGARFGAALAGGSDIDGDGFDDLLVGAPGFDGSAPDSGAVFLYRGSFRSMSASPSATLRGTSAGAEFGAAVAAAGDADDDGLDDVLVGAPGFDGHMRGVGRAYLFAGTNNGLSVSPRWSIEGAGQAARLGSSLAFAGDINGDGFGDVIVGAPGFTGLETGEGAAMAFFGSSSGLSATADWRVEGRQSGAQLGRCVGSAGDADGDGFADLAVGVPGRNGLELASGAVLIFAGSATGLRSEPSRTLVGSGAGARFGSSLARVGDVDQDGRMDLAVGASWNQSSAAARGRAFVFGGSSVLLGTPGPVRITTDLLALYPFDETSGATVNDTSGVGTPLNLTIQNLGAVSRPAGGGLSIDAATGVVSTVPGTKIIDACQLSDEVTLEAWVEPGNLTQSGPARIVALSVDGNSAGGNAILSQRSYGGTIAGYQGRIRSTSSNSFGQPNLDTAPGTLTTALTHVVLTRDSFGVKTLYLNGVVAGSATTAGDFSNWDAGTPLALANEPTLDRPWLGVLRLVAVYSRALSAGEVDQNFQAGLIVMAPGDPTGLDAVAFSDVRIDLSWTDTSNNETSFEIERSLDGGTIFNPLAVVPANTSVYSDLGLVATTEYCYRVRAVNGGGASGDTPSECATTLMAPMVPAAPSGLAAMATSSSTIALSWMDNASNEAAFEVERSDDGGSTFGAPTVVAANATSYVDTGLSGGMEACYRVRATNSAGASGYTMTVCATTPLTSRVVTDLLVLYPFDETSGATVNDTSGVGMPLNLTIENLGAVSRPAGGGLSIDAATGVVSTGAASKVIAGCQVTNEITLEAWIEPENLTQRGPARIVALSVDGNSVGANAMLGQRSYGSAGSGFQARVRSTSSNQYGQPSVDTAAGTLTTELVHVVITRDASGAKRIYLDGVLVETGSTGGNFSNWDASAALALANEPLLDRPWLGVLRLVAIYGRALTQPEVEQNYMVGLDVPPLMAPAAPSGLTATAITDARIDLAWTDNSSNESGFEVEVSLDAGATFGTAILLPAGTTAYSDTGLQANTEHCYRVRAVNAAGASGDTPSECATTLMAPMVPAAPSGLAAMATSSSTIALSWMDNASDEAAFEVQRSDDGGSTFGAPTVVAANATSYVDTGLSGGMEACYRVRATNSAGASGYTMTVCATTPLTSRVVTDLLVLYPFDETSGATVNDTSGVGMPLNLTIENLGAVSRPAGGGLSIDAATGVVSTGAASKVIAGCQVTNEITLEAWIEPDNLTQRGPARIVALSVDGNSVGANAMLGQRSYGSAGSGFQARVRSTSSNQYGQPSVDTAAGTLTTELVHVVITRDASGAKRIYLDGVLVETGSTGGNFSNWDASAALALANEPLLDRPWLGVLRLVAIYGRALTQPEVEQNYMVGLDVPPLMAPAAPSGLTATAITDARIDLAWTDNSSNESGFEVEVSLDAGATFGTAILLPAGTTAYSDTGLQANTEHCYRVRAVNAAGASGDTPSECATTLMAPMAPAAPSGLAAMATSSSTIALSWMDNASDEAAFEVERSDDGGSTFGAPTIVAANATSYVDTGLSGGMEACYRVRATNSAGASGYTMTVCATTPLTARVVTDLLVLYPFDEPSGNQVHDASGVGMPMNLTVQNPGAVSWLPGGGLSIDSPTGVLSAGPGGKVLAGCQATNEISIEAWLEPNNLAQGGPARIVTLSVDGNSVGANAMLGQRSDGGAGAGYQARVRSTSSNNFGQPAIDSAAGTLTTNLTHVILTRDASGAKRLYINGALVESSSTGGDFSNWDAGAVFALGNEPTLDRPWLGVLRLVAVYNRALNPSEVNQNFAVGPIVPMTPPTILVQPSDRTVGEGQSATLTVAAFGSQPLAYQWQVFNTMTALFEDVAGANSPVFTSMPLGLDDDGTQYRCVVSNAFMPDAISEIATVSVIVVGDTFSFAAIGDYGSAGPNEASVANLVAGLNPNFVITTGDNNYSTGSAATIDANVGQYFRNFIAAYTGSYPGVEPALNGFFPTLGNHDWDNGSLQPYTDYFTLPGAGVATSNTSGNERYYDFVQGPIHFFMLDSDQREPDGTSPTSTQGQWLQAALGASTSPWKLVVFHHPAFSSSSVHGSSSYMQWPFEDWGVDAVFSGHDHTYERVHRDDNGDGRETLYFVTGLGGRSLYNLGSPVSGSEVRYNSDYGTMFVEANEIGITFQFYSVSDGLVDSYTLGSPPSGLAPGAVIIAGFQPGQPEVQDPGEYVALFNTTSSPISLSGLDLISRVDLGSGDGVLDIDWRLADESPDLAGKFIAPFSFFLIGESGVAGESGVVDLVTNMDLATGEGGAAERAIGLELSIDLVHMDHVLYGRSDGSDTSAQPAGDLVFDGFSFPRNEVIRNTLGTANFSEGVCRRLTPSDLFAGFDVAGFYTDEDALPGSNPGGVWASPHDPDFGSYSARSSASAPVLPPATDLPDGDPTGLLVTAVDGSSVALTWTDNSTNEAIFVIERKLGTSGTFAFLVNVAANSESYLDTTVAGDSEYCYRVKGTNSLGDSGFTNEACDTTPMAPLVATFQQGVAGYVGTQDTYLQEALPTAVNGAAAAFEWDDNDPNASGGLRNFALLRFDDIFGAGAGQVPDGSVITSATVSYTVFDVGGTAGVREMLLDWNEGNNLTDICGADCDDGLTYAATIIDTASAIAEGTFDIDVTASLQAWSIDPSAAYGWAFVPPSPPTADSGGVQMRSSEYATVGQRPRLTVEFTPPAATTEPAAPSGVSVTPTSSSTLLVEWTDNATNEASFLIERMGPGGTTVTQVAANTVAYSDSGLDSLTEYCYSVTAVNAIGSSIPTASECATTLAPISAGAVIIAGFQPAAPTGQGEHITLFNTTNQTILLEGLELISTLDIGTPNDTLEVEWTLSGEGVDLTGKSIAPYSFFLVAEAGVDAPGNLHDVEVSMDLATGEGGPSERAIGIELLIDGTHMDHVLYGRSDGSDTTGQPSGDIAFDGTSFPRDEVIRVTTGGNNFGDGLVQRLSAGDLFAGHDVSGFYTDEGSLPGSNPVGVWSSPHSDSFSAYQARNSSSLMVPPPATEAPDGDPTGLTVQATTLGQLDLTWTDNATNEANYAVERSTNGGSTFGPATLLPANTVAYTDSPVLQGSEYCYRVRAVNFVGESAYTNVVCATALSNTIEPNFVAYNDFNVLGSDGNPANVTKHTYESTGAALKDLASGADVPITLTGSTTGNYDPISGSNGGQCDEGTDAADAFGPTAGILVDLRGSVELDTPGDTATMTLENLDPTKMYSVTVSHNRDNVEYTGRWTRVTLQGAEAFLNESSAGVSVADPGNFGTQASVSFNSGYNTVNGHVARWTGIQPGVDGTIAILSEREDGFGASGEDKGYAMTGLKLEEFTASTNATEVKFAAFGDYGFVGSGIASVANLINTTLEPDLIATSGDNSYGSVSVDDNIGQYYADWIGNYNGAHGPGAETNRFFPTLGNHDYTDGAGLSAYLDYFTLPGEGIATSGTSGNERYYDFVQGPVHFFMVNSNGEEPDGRSSVSVQAQWLQAQLAASTSPWKVVFMHHPPYSSAATHGNEAIMQWPYEAWGADAVIAGHDHTYERIHKDEDNDGRDMLYFVTGLGGRSVRGFASTLEAGSQAGYGNPPGPADFGTMLVTATPTTILYEFYSVNAAHGTAGLIDSYLVANGSGPDASPSGLTASAVSSSQIDLAWADNASDETSYQVERSLNSGATFAPLVMLAADAADYSDTSVVSNTEYCYRVRAANAGGSSAYSNEACDTTPIVPGGLAPGDVIIAGFQPSAPTGQGEHFTLFNTTDQAISLANLEILTRLDIGSANDTLEVEWTLSGESPDLSGKSIAAHSFFLIAEPGVVAPNGVHDLEVNMDLATGEGGLAERAIGIELLVDGLHMDHVLYGRASGSDSTAQPDGDLAFDGSTFPRDEVIRGTTGDGSFLDGLLQRLSAEDLYAGHDVNGFYTDEDALAGSNPAGVWTSPHDSTFSAYVVRNSESPVVAAPSSPDGDPSGLTAMVGTVGRIDLEWIDGASNETRYEVERSTDGGSVFSLLATLGADSTSYVDTGLEPVAEYCYRVRASNSGGSSNYTLEACATTLDDTVGPLFVAYNDFNVLGIDGNAGNVTKHDYLASGAALRDFASGLDLPIVITGSTTGDYDPISGVNGGQGASGTDAAAAFGPTGSVIVDLRGSVELDTPGDTATMTLENLDPKKVYSVTVSHNRDNVEYTGRWTRVTLQGADAFLNESSAGVSVADPGNFGTQASVSFNSGYNTVNGHVARWTGIQPGVDGTIAILSEREDGFGASGEDKGYAMTGLKLEEFTASTNATEIKFAAFGDYGFVGSGIASVANLINTTLEPDLIATSGDNSYGSASVDDNIGQYYADWIGNYNGAYGPGAETNRFFPTLGNHDYTDGAGLSAYLDYFTLPGEGIATSGTSGNERYYDFVQGPVHFFMVNSNGQEPDGRSSVSVQAQWLQAQLAASTSAWNVVFMHHPPYSSAATHGNEAIMQWPYEAWGADAVIAGHDHTYERIHKDEDNDGTDMLYFVTGLGGRSVRGFASTLEAGSQAGYGNPPGPADFGTMLVTATPTTILYEFYSVNAAHGTAGLIDSYYVDQGPAEVAAPSGLVGASDSAEQISLSWNDNSNNESGFEVERSLTGSGGPFAQLAVLPANSEAYINNGLLSDREYCYRVRALGSTPSNFTTTECLTTPALPAGPGDDFTIVMLPDTQFYSEGTTGSSAGIFEQQTQWIADNWAALDIAYVAHVGDCVQTASDQAQWDVADGAIQTIEDPAAIGRTDGAPFGIAVGNHDQTPTGDSDGSSTSLYNQTFGEARFASRAYYGGHFGANNDNHFDLFEAGGLKFVVIYFEYDTTQDQDVLDWANGVLQAHADRRGIIASHYLMESGEGGSFGAQGQEIYDELKGNPNLFLMLCGHVSGEGKRTDVFSGNTVHTLLADYQSRSNGGDGWLRYMTFSPSSNQIRVNTYSPTLDQEETDANSQFTLTYDMGGMAPSMAVFQPGINGGVEDTIVEAGTGPVGGLDEVVWDTDPTLRIGLLKFTGLFGDSPGQIPVGSTIHSATFQYQVHDTSTSPEATVNEVLVDWNEADTDFENFGGEAGVQADEYGSEVGLASTAAPAGARQIDVTSSLQGWSATPAANHGWVFRPNGGSGGGFRSSEHSVVGERPSLEVSFTPPVPTTVPEDPSGLQASAVATDRIQVTWTDNSTDEGVFELQRSDGGGSFATLVGNLPAETTVYDDDTVATGVEYCYQVRAINAVGPSGFSNSDCATTLLAPPNAPSGLSATSTGTDEVTLAWSDNSSDETSFELERSVDGAAFASLASLGVDATGYVDTTAVAGNEYCYRVQAGGASGDSAFSSTACAPSLGLSLDGVDQYVTFGNAAELGLPVFTLELWFKRDGAGQTVSTGGGGLAAAVPLLTKGRGEGDGSNVDANYFLGIDGATGVLAADFEDTGGAPNNHPVLGSTPILAGSWYHAAATYDGDTWRLYLNGVLEATQSEGGATPRSDSIQHAGIGTALNSAGTPSGFFHGCVDEVRVWSSARTGVEIAASAQGEVVAGTALVGRWGLNQGAGTTAANSVPGGAVGTHTNMPLPVSGSPFEYAFGLALDGTDDYATFGNNPALGLSTYTLELWFMRTAAGVGVSTGGGGLASAIPLITKGRGEGDGSNLDANYFLGIDSATGVLVGDFEDTTSAPSPNNHPVFGVTPIAIGAWYHAAATFDGDAWQLYLNGVPELGAGGQSESGATPRFDSVQHAGIGTAMTSTGSPAGFFAGLIDEVRIWDVARSGIEIADNLDLEISSAAGLVGRWGLNEGAGTNIAGAGIDGTLVGGAAWGPSSPFALERVATFQDGTNGTVVDNQLEAGAVNGSIDEVVWDTSPLKYGLLRFDGVFGPGAGQVPVGSSIVSASITYFVHDTSTSPEATVNEVLVDWDEATVFEDFGGSAGVDAGDYGAEVGAASTAEPAGYKSLDVTASLASWSADPSANRGWIFRPNGSSGGGFYSHEHTTASQTPSLVVVYTTPAP